MLVAPLSRHKFASFNINHQRENVFIYKEKAREAKMKKVQISEIPELKWYLRVKTEEVKKQGSSEEED